MKSYTCCIAAIVLLPMCTSSDPATPGATPADGQSTATAQSPSAADPAQNLAQHPFETVGDAVKPDTPNAAFYDFGTLSLARTQPIQHDFKLHNDASYPILISRIQAACGCTTPTSPDIGIPGNYKPVEPGQDFTVKVAVDPGHLYAGTIDKMVWVYVTGQSNPAFTLHMVGTMTAAATFEPPVLNFGSVQAGAGATRKLTVTMDTSAYGQNPPDPISTNPDVRIKRDGSDPASGTQVTRTYDVILSPSAHIGGLQATIAMPQAGSTEAQGVGPSVFVTGNVTGELTAAPQSVAFGAVMKGKSVTQQIVLTGATAGAVEGLKIKCGDKELTGSIKNVQTKSAVLEVTFDPATAGAMQSKVTLITKNGQQLDLPVWAWVNQ